MLCCNPSSFFVWTPSCCFLIYETNQFDLVLEVNQILSIADSLVLQALKVSLQHCLYGMGISIGTGAMDAIIIATAIYLLQSAGPHDSHRDWACSWFVNCFSQRIFFTKHFLSQYWQNSHEILQLLQLKVVASFITAAILTGGSARPLKRGVYKQATIVTIHATKHW